jgi:hypothetical protein
MRNEIAGSLLSLLVIRAFGLDTSEVVGQRGIDLDAWTRVLPTRRADTPNLEVSAERLALLAAETAGALVPLLLPWIMRAPLNTLVTLSPEAFADVDGQIPMDSADRELYERYAWLVDRFSTTSTRDWLTSSLHCEYRWQAEREPPPCPVELMLDREVSQDELNAEIARRAVLQIPNGEPDAEAVLATEMAGHALALLRQRHCREAAALFEFAAKRRPADAEARNNLGFCLIPENPRRALFDLETAANMGYQHTAVNIYNRVCCHLALRQTRAAVALAEKYWTERDDPPGGATLWRPGPDGSWDLINVSDTQSAIAELLVEITRTEGLRDEEQVWRERMSSRQGGGDTTMGS